jgi:predicted RNase H-like nuclease (RuvC/YqgF family)
MIRIILAIVALIFTSSGFSQVDKSTENGEKLTRLQQKNEQLTARISNLESMLFALRTDLKVSQEKVDTELLKGQELQAQNERSMNLALDGFAEKFEKQNETVKGVQQELSKKYNNQLVMFALGFVALVVLFSVANRSSTQKALRQNTSNWNSFQEHLLKK